jgi:pimeloyl-ACP methyl ester carboxylesterase
MKCRLIPDVIDFARSASLDRARADAVTAHLRICASCGALAQRERALSMALHRLADDVPAESPRVNEIRLGRLLAHFDAPPQRIRRAAVRVGLALAASVVIVAGLYLVRKNAEPVDRVSQVAATPPSPTNAAEFVVLPGAGALPHFERGEVIRIQIQSPEGPMQADVLVGQDGLARAVRFVE